MNTLQELVSLALAQNDASTKVAAARDAEPTDPGEELLASALGQLVTTTLSPAPASEKVASVEEPAGSALDVAAHGLKIAEALRSAADVVKVAFSTELPTSSGEHTHEGGKHPAAEGPHGKDIPSSVGAVGALANDGDKPAAGKGPSNTPGKGKTASADERLLQAKVAEAKVLASMGQTDAAEKVAKEIESLKAKVAGEAGALETSSEGGPGASSSALTNEALINMTRAQARNASVQQAGSLLSTPVRVDPAVAALVGKSDGVKVSSLRELIGLKAEEK
jgi:hypothetical protein